MEQFRSDTTEPTVVHRQTSPHYGLLDDDTYYPISHQQLRDLLGRVLTHLDAMGLPDRAHRAARTLLTQDVWRWWGEAAENATTSAQGCLAPIVMTGNRYPGDDTTPPSNRWGWASEDAFLAGQRTGERVSRYLGVDREAAGTVEGNDVADTLTSA